MDKSRNSRSGVGWLIRGAVYLLFVFLSGCATFRTNDSAQYIRDGVKYGVTEGTFRGRWWNYYERGRSFLDGRYWAEAERDLKTAVAARGRDQLWSRTYGLHFLPEYFPHRELGIAYYYQERLLEAEQELVFSLNQQYSARAAYFLNETRRLLLEQQQADQTPPVITLSPFPSSVGALSIQINGVTTDDTYVAALSINNEAVPVLTAEPKIPFSEDIALRPGKNQIEIMATDLSGKTSVVHAQVTADLDGPAVSFDTPLLLPGQVTGMAYDSSGVSSIDIAGKTAHTEILSDGMIAFSVLIQQEELKPPFLYKAFDSFGNVTRGQLPLSAVAVLQRNNETVFADYQAPRVVSGNMKQAFIFQNAILFVAADNPGATEQPTVHFANLRDGQRFLLEEIAVSLDIDTPNSIEQATLNGLSLDLIPGRTVQRISRRVPLEIGVNQLTSTVRDSLGKEAQAAVTIERNATSLDAPQSRLNIAILGQVWRGNSPKLENETDVILESLTREIEQYRRFGGIVDREHLPEILAEQELSAAIGNPAQRLALGKTIPADMMIVGRVHRDAETLEIVVEGYSTETSQRVLHADVAGRADTIDQIERLAKELALHIVQEFPRASGNVALIKTNEVFVANLGESDRIRESMKYIVFRPSEPVIDPNTGENLGQDSDVIGEALVKSVDARKSTAEIVKLDLPPGVQVGDKIVAK